jgi:hypothetical protein
MTDKIETAFIISYVPLLRGQAGDLLSLNSKNAAQQIKDIYDNYIDTDVGTARGCAWCMSTDDDSVGLVFAIEKAAEIHDHLTQWAEGVPQRWFDLCLYDAGARYAIALMPNFERSVERFKEANRTVNNIEIAKDAKFQLIAKPILFISDPDPVTFYKIKGKIGKRIQVGLVDPSKIANNAMKADDVLDLGSFKMNSDMYTEYLAEVMK